MDDINSEQYMKSIQWSAEAQCKTCLTLKRPKRELKFGKAPILMSHWLTGVAATI